MGLVNACRRTFFDFPCCFFSNEGEGKLEYLLKKTGFLLIDNFDNLSDLFRCNNIIYNINDLSIIRVILIWYLLKTPCASIWFWGEHTILGILYYHCTDLVNSMFSNVWRVRHQIEIIEIRKIIIMKTFDILLDTYRKHGSRTEV